MIDGQPQEFKGSIVRRYVLRDGDLDGGTVQDALAIVKFPRLDAAATNADAQRRVAAVHDHLCKWGAKELSDPFHPTTRDILTMLDIHTLCRRMWLYIEDYLSKATSRYLPRAYRQLPLWSHSHFSGNLFQTELVQDVNQLDMNSLECADRQSILQAFLRYELLCKIYGPVAAKRDTRSDGESDPDDWAEQDSPDGHQFDENDPFRYWDWSTLYRYEKREPEETELQLLPCVREYVLAMYGALIANHVQAPTPVAGGYSEYENAPSNGMGGFPGHNPDNEYKDPYYQGGTGWSECAVSLMATSGFDLLTTTLTSSSGEFVGFLVEFATEILLSPPFIDATNVYLPISAPSCRGRISWHCNDYIRLNRQRTWPLLGDAPKYPQIPSVDEYRRVYGPGPLGGLVGWGSGMDHTRNEWIAHGQGTMAYFSLISKMVPFWERCVARGVV